MNTAPEEKKVEDPDAIIQEHINCSRSPYKRSSRKVMPHLDNNDNGSELYVEIRPKRILRVVHLCENKINLSNNIGESDLDVLSEKEKRNIKPDSNERLQNSFTFQTSAQVNHVPSQNSPKSSSTQNMSSDDISHSASTLSQQFLGVENDGFDDSIENILEENSPQSDVKSNSKSNGFINQVSKSSFSQDDNVEKPQCRNILERSATTRNVDIELEDSVSTTESGDTNTHVNNLANAEQNSTEHKRICTMNTCNNTNAVLFFLHGVGGSIDVWRQQLDYFFSEGYEIVCPDIIGHGFSAAPHSNKAYTFEEISIDLLLIFDMFCKKQNVVIGHSYGCSFAAVLARQRHRKVNKLILVSGGSPIPLAPQPGIFSLPTCVLACMKPIISRGFRKSAFNSKNYISQDKAFDVPSYVLKYIMKGQWWPDGGAEYHQWIKAATLLIHGAQDKLVLIEEEEEMLETIFGSRMQVIDDASHMVMMEKPDEVNKIIHDFLLQSAPVATSIRRTSTRTREALKKKPWLRRALSKSKTCAIEPIHKQADDTVEPSANGNINGMPKSSQKSELDRKGSSLSLKSVKSLPHDLLAGNLY